MPGPPESQPFLDRLSRAQALSEGERIDEAIAEYREALKLDPASAEAVAAFERFTSLVSEDRREQAESVRSRIVVLKRKLEGSSSVPTSDWAQEAEGMSHPGTNNPIRQSARTLLQTMVDRQVAHRVMHAASGRPSVSRVLENCKHGLNGGLRKPEVIRPTGA